MKIGNMTNAAKLAIFLLRVAIGWLFFYAGWSKVITYFTDAKDWTASGFLGRLEGPFSSYFSSMAGSPLVDKLNAWGLLLIGIAMILGILVRWSAFWGIIIMILYWAAGFPPDNAIIIDDHIIYSLVFIVLAAIGAGRIWGLDNLIEKSNFVKSNSWILKLLG